MSVVETKYNTRDILYGLDGAMRTSQKTILGRYTFLKDLQPLKMTSAGTGSITHSTNKALLAVDSGEYSVLQSKQYHPYFPGFVQGMEFTTENFHCEEGVVKRVGYFSSSAVAPYTASIDGLYIETDDEFHYLVVKRAGTDTIRIRSDQFYQQGMFSIDWSKFNVFFIDFLWLGGAGVRLFIVKDGEFRLVHAQGHSGIGSTTFTVSPNHPIRAEIRGVSAGGSLALVCARVTTEGQVNEIGFDRYVTSGNTPSLNNAGSSGVIYAIKGIRKKTSYRDITVYAKGFQGFINTNDQVEFFLILNPTVAGTFNYSDVGNSAIQEASGTVNNTVTGGTILPGLYSTHNSVYTVDTSSELARLGVNVDDSMDTIVLCGRLITATATIYGNITYRDIL